AAAPRAEGVDPTARGVPGYGVFETADGRHLTLGILTEDHFWQHLCDVLGLVAFRDLGFAARMSRLDELQTAVAGAIRGRDRDALVAELLGADVPVAPVHDRAGMLREPHFGERGVVTRDPWADPSTGYPVRFTNHPAVPTTPPP